MVPKIYVLINLVARQEESVGENVIEAVPDGRGYYLFEKTVTKGMARASNPQTLVCFQTIFVIDG
jgi:hypothetical protein